MSAFIVGRPHISALVEALFRYEVYPFVDDATYVGQELWDENIRSVSGALGFKVNYNYIISF